MTMERQEYPAMLPQLQPPQAVDILNDRVRQVGRLNGAIAEWIQERRKLEEQYSAGLRRLAQKNIDGVDLGVFSTPWSALTDSADQLADSHSAFAAKVEQDVEAPLRDFEKNSREYTAMSTIQGNLASMAKDVERQQQKIEKLQSKGERADSNKVASANSDLDGAQQQWETQAPYVFDTLQNLDETRLNNLRDVLVQLQTHESDLNEQTRKATEHSVNVLLNVEVRDEIQTFVLKASSMERTSTNRKRTSFAPPSREAAGAPTSSSLAPPPMPHQDEESGSVQEDKRKSRFGGLKRLGTVMGRRRESKMPPGAAAISESPERKPKSSPFNALGRRGKGKDTAPSLEPPLEVPSQGRPSSPLRMGSEVFQQPAESSAPPVPATPPAPMQHQETMSQLNGTSPPPVPSTAVNGGYHGDLADLEPPKSVRQEESAQQAAPEPVRDSEGFSVPQQNLDPITQAQQDAAMGGEGAPPQFNVNIRNEPISEEGTGSAAALANVANRLQAPPPTTRRAGTVRGRRQDRNSFIGSPYNPPSETSLPGLASEPVKESAEPVSPPPQERGLPEVQPTNDTGFAQSPSAAFAPSQSTSSAFPPFASQTEQAPPSPFRPESRGPSRSDNHSIRSATTTASQGGHKHPELGETGLNSSVIESVSARFEDGKLISSSIIGEIALAHNPANFTSPTGTETIRLENYSTLEKIAPNPLFLTSSPQKEGEYTVNLAALTKTHLAFKYQAHSPTSASPAPLHLTQTARIEPTQLSIIVSYALHPDFALPAGEPQLMLKNVMLALHVDGARASACQSKPVGTFSREKNLIFWQLGDVALTPGGQAQKLLARFTTEGQASAGNVEARWEVSHEGVGSGVGVSVVGAGGAAGESVDPFADEDAGSGAGEAAWKGLPGVRRLVSGNYVAK